MFCSTLFCGLCLVANVQRKISLNEWEHRGKTSSWPGQSCAACGICCAPCNRRRVALHYSIAGEPCPQSFLMSVCCPICSLCQILHEASIKEGASLGKPCRYCCCECVFSGKALGKRYLNRNMAPSRCGAVAPAPVDADRGAHENGAPEGPRIPRPEHHLEDDIEILDYDERDEDGPAARPAVPKRNANRVWLGRPFTVESTEKRKRMWLHHKESWSLG